MTDDELAAIEYRHWSAENTTDPMVEAESRADIPALLAEVRRLRAENEELLALPGRVNPSP